VTPRKEEKRYYRKERRVKKTGRKWKGGEGTDSSLDWIRPRRLRLDETACGGKDGGDDE